MFSYDEAFQKSLEYFNGDELAANVFLSKYALKDNEGNLLEDTPTKMHWRIANEFARIEEKKFKTPLTAAQIFSLLDKFVRIIPQGSPMFGIGNDYQTISLSNCYVVESPEDSYGGILKTDQQLVQISKRRGGVGVDLSKLRPKGTITKNAARTSTGIVSWMERYSNSIREVGQCLEENQRVLTLNGLKKIKDITVKDKVWTKIGWVQVLGVVNNGKKEVYKTTSKSGYEVLTSKDHIFQTFDYDGNLTETRLEDLTIGDKIVLCLGTTGQDKSYIKLEKSEYTNSNNKPDNCILPEILDEKLAYVLGYSYGDGSIENDEYGSYALCLACSNDYLEIKNKLDKYTKEVFDYQIKYRNGDGDLERLSINNKTVVEFLKHNRILKGKTENLHFPDSITSSPVGVQASFLSGYFDADGYASGKKKGYCFSSIDLDFIKESQKLLLSFGIPSKIHEEDRSEIGWQTLYSLVVVGKTAQQKFVKLLSESIKIQQLNHISKRDCWLTPFKAKSFSIKHNLYSYCPDNSQNLSMSVIEQLEEDSELICKNLIQDELYNIERIGESQTYDLILEKEHLFWCEGYYVHNSGRRGALMETISVHHPDVLDFATVKNDNTKVTGANISIKLSNEFLKAVDNDEEYELRFPIDYKERGILPKVSKLVKAREVWNVIINSAWLRAEPGLLFWDNIIENNAVDCYANHSFSTVSTNPCSELPLCEFDSCRLLIQNLFFYVKNPFTNDAEFDYDLFYNDAIIAQRLMDDMIDLEIEKIDKILSKIDSDPESNMLKTEERFIWNAIREKCINGRRTGLGITATGDTLAALGIKYGSDESINIIEKIHRTQKLASFRSSVDMAKEIGPFPIWDWDTEKESKFIQQIKKENIALFNDIKKYGRRNIANLTIAPTGSVSILAQTSSGIEPVFNLSYKRRKKINPNDKNSRIDFTDQNGDNWQEFDVYHHKVKLWMEITGETNVKKSPWYGATANDIDWINRVKLQAAAQKHIDHAISSTINLPEDVTEQKVAEIYLAAWREGVKGITVYRDNCRSGVLVNKKEEKSKDCGCNNNKILKTNAPKRPAELSAEAHFFTVSKQRYYVIVGLLDKDVYEVFTGLNYTDDGDIFISKNDNIGIVRKVGSGNYVYISNEKEYSLTNGHSDDTADALTRNISLSLRHGVPIQYLVEQLSKTKGPMTSFSKCISRTIKKYIENNTSSTEKCGNCGAKLVFSEGCQKCPSCGSSKCN